MIGNIDDDGHSEMETRCPPPGHERHSGTVDDEDSAEEEKGVGLAFTAVDIDDAGQRGSALTRRPTKRRWGIVEAGRFSIGDTVILAKSIRASRGVLSFGGHEDAQVLASKRWTPWQAWSRPLHRLRPMVRIPSMYSRIQKGRHPSGQRHVQRNGWHLCRMSI